MPRPTLPIYYMDTSFDITAAKFAGTVVAITKGNTKTVNVSEQEVIDSSQGIPQKIVKPAYTYQAQDIFIQLIQNYDPIFFTSVELKEENFNAILETYNPTTGELNLESSNNYACRDLFEIIQAFVKQKNFPYKYCDLHFSKDGTTVDIKYPGYFMSNFHPHPVEMEKIHPIIEEHQQKENDPGYNILNLLYKIKESPDFELCNRLIRKGGIPVGFGLVKGVIHETTVDLLIEAAHKSYGTTYLPSETFIKLINDIIRQSDGTKLTAEKQRIWNDFLTFYQSNLGNPDMMPRCVMVEAWTNNFMKKYDGQNPFITLSKYRGTGILGFHIKPTDSMDLFNQFLAGELIPDSLKNLMDGLVVGVSKRKSLEM